MKGRHMIALASVGWYPMTPPASGPPGEGGKLREEAPYSQWYTQGSFDSATECNTQKQRWGLGILNEIVKKPPGHRDQKLLDGYAAIDAGRCVASDDPRLRVNYKSTPNTTRSDCDACVFDLGTGESAGERR